MRIHHLTILTALHHKNNDTIAISILVCALFL